MAGIVIKEERASTTLDLIDGRIRQAVHDGNSLPIARGKHMVKLKASGTHAHVDVDEHGTGSTVSGWAAYYRIRRPGAFAPLITIDVMMRGGLYFVSPDDKNAPYKSEVYEATHNKRENGRVGFLADELDAPMQAIEALIVEVLDK